MIMAWRLLRFLIGMTLGMVMFVVSILFDSTPD